MTSIPKHLIPAVSPVADPKAIVACRNARFTVITPRLIRMEYSPSGTFEDRASLAFWHRRQPVPVFKSSVTQKKVEIATSHLQLSYEITDGGFTPATLSITLGKGGRVWHCGDENHGNLGGTYRTLDGCDGAVKIPDGLVSRDGWSLVDDSATMTFDERGWPVRRRPLDERGNPAADAPTSVLDLYFFGYGTDYQACLADFFRVSGRTPLIPRWMLGNWWSRYWAYSQDDLVKLIGDFKANDIPLSVCIIDMDWHIVKNAYTGGWTGYTWNKEYFWDPEGFFTWLHGQGLKTALNLHPADGVHPHEAAYKEMAKAVGVDPRSKKPVPFDIADPVFAKAYFEKLHHPLEKQGVDFWWMDWQQPNVKGVDPLFLLNHLHSLDVARDGSKRPIAFSRWGGLGSHRYPIGFSGDTHVTWKSLAFQPYFTATAANVGYYLWSHDIGGHFQGEENDELFARWVQFGAFSPILRIHSSKSRFQDRRPWVKNGDASRVIRRFMQLRHELQPYIYTMVRKGTEESVPLVKPMYWDHPADERAYAAQNQYCFGTELLVAPFTTPLDPDTTFSRTAVWLPKGDWYNIFSGEYCAGDRFTAVYGKLDEMPVYARAGAIVPMATRCQWGETGNPAAMTAAVFAGADGHFELYEDDGATVSYQKGATATTRISQRWSPRKLTVTIDPVAGDASVVPAAREWDVVVFGIKEAASVVCTVGRERRQVKAAYDAARECLRIPVGRTGPSARVTLTPQSRKTGLLSRRDRRQERVFDMLFSFRLSLNLKEVVWRTLEEMRKDPDAVDLLAGTLKPAQAQALIETLFDAGYEWFHANARQEKNFIAFWNNSGSRKIKYQFASRWGSHRSKGVMPRSLVIGFQRRNREQPNALWVGEGWTLGVNYAGVTAVSADSGY